MAGEHTTTNPLVIPPTNTSSGGSVVSPEIQKFAKGIYANEGDKVYATYELSELQALPKSLFYEASTATPTYRGLFAYYVLGNHKGTKVNYYKSETSDYLKEITPIESRNPTAKMIIDTVSKKESAGPNQMVPSYLNPNSPYRGQIYNVKDFIFCKHYGIIPNNRMLTLRRFAYPTLDSLKILPDKNVQLLKEGDNVKTESISIAELGMIKDFDGTLNTSLPVAQAVTYFGDDTGNNLSTILGISTGLTFRYEGQEQMRPEQSGDPGLINSPFGSLIKAFVASGDSNINLEDVDNLIGTFAEPNKNINALKRKLLDNALQADGPLSKKIFVNVNTVSQMMVRKQGFEGGIAPFTLNFYYNLTSVGTINTKLLFLDLMTNLLSIGTDYGQFLAPELRLEQTSVGLGFPGGAQGYAKSIVDPIGYLKEQVSRVLSSENVKKQLSAEGSIGKDIEEAAEELNKFIHNPDEGIPKEGKFYKSISVLLSDMFLKRIYYQPLMLSGYPTGEWHLVVGNPLNPIAMIGNLVCTNVSIDFNNDLGPDDFPTEIKATFTLSPGRQRHRGDWESMFNRGNGRLYLGQLVSNGETSQAYVTTGGVFPNQGNQNIEGLTQSTSSTGNTSFVN